MYLYDSLEEFFASPMWTGVKYYGQEPIKPWFEWIYVAVFQGVPLEEYLKDDNPLVKIKFGRTSNIDQRARELDRDIKGELVQHASSIVYAWSVPSSTIFENDIKRLLNAFIRPDAFAEPTKLSTEITWGIPIVPLINLIQLSILHTCIQHRYIDAEPFKLQPPDVIKDGKETYNGVMQGKVPHVLDIDKQFAKFERYPPNVKIKRGNMLKQFKKYLFPEDNRIPNPKIKDKPELYVDHYLEVPVYMKGKVYKVGSLVYTKWRGSFYPTQILGYGDVGFENQYLVRWLNYAEDGAPIKPYTSYKKEPEFVEPERIKPYRSAVPANIIARHKDIFEEFALDKERVPAVDIENTKLRFF